MRPHRFPFTFSPNHVLTFSPSSAEMESSWLSSLHPLVACGRLIFPFPSVHSSIQLPTGPSTVFYLIPGYTWIKPPSPHMFLTHSFTTAFPGSVFVSFLFSKRCALYIPSHVSNSHGSLIDIELGKAVTHFDTSSEVDVFPSIHSLLSSDRCLAVPFVLS